MVTATGSISKTDEEVIVVVSSQSQTLRVPPRVRTAIRSIKEILKNHSDAEIYAALKESNMDPNETAQKLLNQDPFLEVKRKRDKRKENVMQVYAHRRNHSQNVPTKDSPVAYNGRRGGYPRKMFPINPRYARRALSNKATMSTKFRVVKDNRLNHNANGEVKFPSEQCQVSSDEKGSLHDMDRGLMVGSVNDKPSGGRNYFQASVRISSLQDQRLPSSSSVNLERISDKDNVGFLSTMSTKPASRPHSASSASSSSVVRLYSSSTDPVHSPSPDRSNSAVGAIKREVGVVGGQRHLDNSKSSVSTSNSPLRREHTSSKSCPPSCNVFNQTTVTQSLVSVNSGSRILRSQNGSKMNQPVAGHQKASQPVKEWKAKSSKNYTVSNSGTTCAPSGSITSPKNVVKDVSLEAAKLQDKLSQIHIKESSNVIIAEHIRVSDADRSRLTFGSFEMGSGCCMNTFPKEAKQEQNGESATSLSISATSLGDNTSSNKQLDIEEQPIYSQADSPASPANMEHQFIDQKESDPSISNNYGDVMLVQDDIQSFGHSGLQQQHDAPELPNFLQAYDPRTGSELPYCRTPMEEAVGSQGLPSPLEALSSHATNSLPASSIAIGGQQQPLAQMYPQFHVSHFANLMPYRQFLSPVYVPPMGVPGYSSNPAYPHLSTGNSFMLMGGGNTHLNTGLKYGGQPFKALPAGSAGAFGNFVSPAGCAVSPPSVVGSAPGLDDSSWSKFKDNNLYISNPQAETSEMWIPNPREHSGMQSSAYYNMAGQTPHAAYLPSHTGHASVNPAAAQSSHMQFPGLFHHPPQHAAPANPHHLGTPMSGNVGVGVAAPSPVAQVGTYQQPQRSHLNWKMSF